MIGLNQRRDCMFVLGGAIVTAKLLTFSLWDSKTESRRENVTNANNVIVHISRDMLTMLNRLRGSLRRGQEDLI